MWEGKWDKKERGCRVRKEKCQKAKGEIEPYLRIGDSLVLCLCACLCGIVGGYECQVAQFLLISTYSISASNNSIKENSLEVTVFSECCPGLLGVRNGKQDLKCGEFNRTLRTLGFCVCVHTLIPDVFSSV